MASQAVKRGVDGHLQEPRKRGRPKGSTNLTPEQKRLKQGASEIDYTRWNNVFQKPADFFVYMAGYPDKTGLLVYLFRLAPKVDATLIGSEDFSIHKTKDEAEMADTWIAANFGRGTYKLSLYDGNRPKGQREVAHTFYDLSTVAKAPVYDYRTLVLSDNKNVDEINRLINIGVMVRDRQTGLPRLKTDESGNPIVPGAVAPAAAPAAASLGALDLGMVVAQLLGRLATSPHESVKDTIETAKLLIPPVSEDSIVTKVVAQLGGKTGNEDPWATYERMDAILQSKIPKPANGAGSAALDAAVASGVAPSWAVHVPGILSELRQLLPEVWQGIRELRTASTGPAQNGGGQQLQRQQQPVTVENVAAMALQRMNEGVKGFDFAAYLCGFVPGGLEVYQQLEPVGAAGVIAFLAMHPRGKQVANDPQLRPQLEAFLDDFFQFDPTGGAGAGEAEPEAGGAAAG